MNLLKLRPLKRVKEDNLYELIHSLSPNEKRFTKRYIKSQKQVQEEYIRFFDVLNNMSNYDKTELMMNVSAFNFDKHIEVKKHHLLQFILDAMRQYRSSSIHYINSLVEIDILIEKGLFALALKRIKIRKRLAELSENFLHLIQLTEKEILLSNYLAEIDSNKLIQEIKNYYEKNENILEYRTLLNELFKLVEINSFVRNAKQLKRYDRFSKNELIQNVSLAKSTLAQIYFNQFNYIYNASLGNQEFAYNYAKKMHKLIKTQRSLNAAFFNLYLRSLIARLSSLFLKGFEPLEFNEIIGELQLQIRQIKDPVVRKNTIAKYYQFNLMAFSCQQRNSEALELVNEAINFIQNIKDSEGENSFVNYLKFDIAKIFFLNQKYNHANKWFMSIPSPKSQEPINDIYTFSRVLSFFCDVFLNDTTNLRYNISYFKKKLSKNAALFEYESFLLSRINTKFINWNSLNKFKRNELLSDFQLELKKQLVNKWKSNTSLYFDFELWIDNMISMNSKLGS
jgi:hypothetical protein